MSRPQRRAVRGSTVHLYLTDPATGERDRVAALRQVRVRSGLSDLPGANPYSYGASYPLPGEFSWSATASGLILLGQTAAERSQGLQLLMRAQRTRLAVPLEVTYPDGVVEKGTALVSGIERAGSYEGLLEGSYQLKGQGLLVEA